MPLAVRGAVQEIQANASVRQFLASLDYPISKADILANAQETGLPASVQEALTKLPDRMYESPEGVAEGLKTVA